MNSQHGFAMEPIPYSNPLLTGLLLLLTVPGTALAVPPASSAAIAATAAITSPASAKVVLRLLGNKPDQPTRERSRSHVELAVGDSGRMNVVAGFIDGEQGPRCSHGASGGDGERQRVRFAHPSSFAWALDVTVDAITLDRYELSVLWTRFEGRDGGSTLVESRSEPFRLPLRIDERRIIDHVILDPPPGVRGPCLDDVFVELSAEAGGLAASLAGRLDYELWLVHRSPNGEEAHRKIELQGQSPGELTRFRFAPTTRRLAELANGSIDVRGEFSGQLRAWPIDAERLTIEVEGRVGRHLELLGREACSSSDGAEQRFVMTAGEVIEIVIPSYRGGCVLGGMEIVPAGALPAGLQLEGKTLNIDMEELLAAHEYALVVKVAATELEAP